MDIERFMEIVGWLETAGGAKSDLERIQKGWDRGLLDFMNVYDQISECMRDWLDHVPADIGDRACEDAPEFWRYFTNQILRGKYA